MVWTQKQRIATTLTLGCTSGAASSSGASSSVRLFTGLHETPGHIMGDLDEDVEIRELTAYDSFGFFWCTQHVFTSFSKSFN